MEFPPLALIGLAAAVGLVAMLYASVGHAGASGYLAVMTLWGMAPAEVRPAALALNVLVATIGAYQFWRAGHFRWSLFWPFALFSVPLAFVGGTVQLPTKVLKQLLGGVLWFSAVRLFLTPREPDEVRPPVRPVALAAGGFLGLLSGLTGVGGGIFLTPLMLLMRWAKTKPTAAVSALFILVNSLAGLTGNLLQGGSIPSIVGPLAIAAVGGGYAGAVLGSRRFSSTAIRLLLGVVLALAGGKLLMPAESGPPPAGVNSRAR